MKKIRNKKKLNISIAFLIIWLFCISIYFLFIFFIKIPIIYTVIILISETLLCFFVWLFFIINIDWLKDINTNKDITYLNISNILSSIRFTLIPLLITMFGLLTYQKNHIIFKIIIFIFACLVCLTDLFDGYLARKFNQVTKLGKILDPIGDFLMIICFSILIYIENIITWWFFILIMIRIPGLVIGALLLIILKIKFKFKTTILGKTTIFYVLCQLGVSSIKLLLNINNNYYDIFLLITQIIGSILLIISSGEKIYQLIYNLKNQDKLVNTKLQF